MAPSFLPMICAVSETERPSMNRSTMHSCCSLPSCCTQESSSWFVRWATTASSGPSVTLSASRMSAVAISSRYRLLFT